MTRATAFFKASLELLANSTWPHFNSASLSWISRLPRLPMVHTLAFPSACRAGRGTSMGV